ncbi:MAG: nickel-binding protein [Roseobacter sp.]
MLWSFNNEYLIERDIPGIGEFSLSELCGAARASNNALANIGPSIQWQHSYVAGEKTFCVYLADSKDDIR